LASTSDSAELASRLRALGAEDDETRREAAAWLRDRPELARPALRALLEKGNSVQRVAWAVDILGRIGDERDVPLLEQLLRKRSGPYWESAQALAKHRSPLALTALRRATSAEDPEVAVAAAVALGVRGDETARADLEKLLDHPDESVRYGAAYALRQLAGTESTPEPGA